MRDVVIELLKRPELRPLKEEQFDIRIDPDYIDRKSPSAVAITVYEDDRPTIILRPNATVYTLLHELIHVRQHYYGRYLSPANELQAILHKCSLKEYEAYFYQYLYLLEKEPEYGIRHLRRLLNEPNIPACLKLVASDVLETYGKLIKLSKLNGVLDRLFLVL